MIAWLAPSAARASDISLRIVGDTTGFSGQVLSQVEALICRPELDVSCDNESSFKPGQKRLVVAIGSKGLTLAESSFVDVPLLSIFPPRPIAEGVDSKRVIGVIHWEMPPGRFLNLISLLPGRRGASVSMLVSATTQSRLVRYEAAGAERGLKVQGERVDKESEVGPAVERLVASKGVFLALPDPVTQTQVTVPPLLLITYRAAVPVIGYSDAYLRAGAAVALYSTPEQVAQQVLDTVNLYRRSGSLPTAQTLKYYSVGINPTVLRSLGITLPSAEELEGRLRQMRE